MAKESEPFHSVSNEEELQRAKWFKEDLEKGEGWKEAANGPGYTYWIKTFDNEEVPIKILFKVDLPFPAKVYPQLTGLENPETRKQWDMAFLDYEVLESFPDGGYVVHFRTVTSCPLTDRSFILYYPPAIEVDWYGKRAHFISSKDAWHPTKPAGCDGLVRATHGGNFYVVTADEDQPEAACQVFGLTNNNYNGWLPSKNVEFLLKKIVPSTINKWWENMIEGYNRFFKSG